MHFIVLGANATGCYIGGLLAAGGRRVTLVGRPRTMEALAATGLLVSDQDGLQARVTAGQLHLATSLAGVRMDGPNVVLLCARGGATESAALEIAACCPHGTSVVSLQNGVDNVARIRAIAPQMQVLAGLATFNLEVPAAGQVHRATGGRLHLEQTDLTREMALLLDACGLHTVLSTDLRPLQWGRLLLNLDNPLNALSDLPLQAQLMDRAYRQLLASLQLEALAVLKRAGLQPARVAALPPRLVPFLLRLPNWLFGRLAMRLLHREDAMRASTPDDLQQGQSIEIGDLCGAVARLAAQHGMTAPHNAAMATVVAGYRKGRHPSGPELRRTALPPSG